MEIFAQGKEENARVLLKAAVLRDCLFRPDGRQGTQDMGKSRSVTIPDCRKGFFAAYGWA